MDENVINGFGSRLNRVENEQSKHCVKIQHNEKNIDLMWEGINKMQKSVDSFLMKIFFMVSVPTILLAIQIISKFHDK